ncbi:MAG: hypothetical protein IT429_22530 [Gemmataceae bacterium]|nr:hypothetical protein [Gemmataceae bacterium]
MSTPSGVDVGCLILQEVVEEANLPKDLTYGLAEPVRPQSVVTFIDGGTCNGSLKNFTVLLRDNRTVTVRGTGLQYVASGSPTDYGSYAILAPGACGEAVVAFFRVSEVTGIFSGEIHPTPRHA